MCELPVSTQKGLYAGLFSSIILLCLNLYHCSSCEMIIMQARPIIQQLPVPQTFLYPWSDLSPIGRADLYVMLNIVSFDVV